MTGLSPAFLFSDGSSTSDAWVRDNTYTSLCVWALSLAYKKLHDSKESISRALELEQVSYILYKCGTFAHIDIYVYTYFYCVPMCVYIFGMVHPSTFERLKTQLVFDSSSNVLTLGVFLSD